MANFNLVIDTSNFKPFTYADIMAPYNDYAKDYDVRKAEIDKFIDDFGNLNLPSDSRAGLRYRQIQDYQNQALESFYKYGLNSRTGQALTKAFQLNKGEVSRMKQGVERYNKMQEKLEALGPDAIVGNTVTIDDIIEGKPTSIKYKSASAIEENSRKIFTAYNNLFASMPEVAGSLAKQYMIIKENTGMNGLDALQAALDYTDQQTNSKYSDKIGQIKSVMDKIYDSQKVGDFNADAQKQVKDNIALGLIESIQAPKYSTTPDQSYINPLDAQLKREQIASSQAQREAQGIDNAIKLQQLHASGYDYVNGKLVKIDGNTTQETNDYHYDPVKKKVIDDKSGQELKVEAYHAGDNKKTKMMYNPETGKFFYPDWRETTGTYREYTIEEIRNWNNQVEKQKAQTKANNAALNAGQFVQNKEGYFVNKKGEKKGYTKDGLMFRQLYLGKNSKGFKDVSQGTAGSIYFNSGSFLGSGDKPMSPEDRSKLTKEEIKTLNEKLAPYHLTIDDVDIYIDKDWIFNDDVKIVPKDAGVNCTYKPQWALANDWDTSTAGSTTTVVAPQNPSVVGNDSIQSKIGIKQ